MNVGITELISVPKTILISFLQNELTKLSKQFSSVSHYGRQVPERLSILGHPQCHSSAVPVKLCSVSLLYLYCSFGCKYSLLIGLLSYLSLYKSFLSNSQFSIIPAGAVLLCRVELSRPGLTGVPLVAPAPTLAFFLRPLAAAAWTCCTPRRH